MGNSLKLSSNLPNVFCCLPLGIAGIIHAKKAKNADSYGKSQAALNTVKNLGIIGRVIGFIFILVCFTAGVNKQINRGINGIFPDNQAG